MPVQGLGEDFVAFRIQRLGKGLVKIDPLGASSKDAVQQVRIEPPRIGIVAQGLCGFIVDGDHNN